MKPDVQLRAMYDQQLDHTMKFETHVPILNSFCCHCWPSVDANCDHSSIGHHFPLVNT